MSSQHARPVRHRSSRRFRYATRRRQPRGRHQHRNRRQPSNNTRQPSHYYPPRNNTQRARYEQELLTLSMQICRRRLQPGQHLKDTPSLQACVQRWLTSYRQEVFAAIFFDRDYRVLSVDVISMGSECEAQFQLRDVAALALASQAYAALFVHNHPAGDNTPSLADQHGTQRLAQLLIPLDIHLHDHWIVSKNGVLSMLDDGYWST